MKKNTDIEDIYKNRRISKSTNIHFENVFNGAISKSDDLLSSLITRLVYKVYLQQKSTHDSMCFALQSSIVRQITSESTGSSTPVIPDQS